LKNEGSGVLERAAVDANLEHAAIKAVLKGVIVAESKGCVFEEFDPERRRIESLVADSGWIINPRSVWECISWRRWQTGIGRLPQHAIRVDCIRSSPTRRKRWRSYAVKVLEKLRAPNWSGRWRCGRRWAWRIALKEANDLENLIGPHLVGHAGVLSVPTGAAGAVAVTRVLPGGAHS
jgi:hypothetical protein